MKQNILQWLCFVVMLLATTACEDYRNNYMVDDKVYLLNPGLTQTTIFNWGEFGYDLYVVKGGKGQQGGRVTLNIDQEILQKYNADNQTAYKLMPADCYSVKTTQLSFGKEDYRLSFRIDFNTAKVKQLQEGSEEVYVVPCQMMIDNNSIQAADEDKMVSIICPVVKQPYLELNNAGVFLPGATFTISSDDQMVIYSKLHTNYYNQWDLTYTLEVDTKVLEEYNKTADKKFQLLPEDAYEIDKSTWVIPAKTDEQYIKINLNKKGLMSGENYLFGNYAIPIRLSSVSMHGINPEASTMLYPVTFQPNELVKTNWAITEWNSCIKEEPQYESLDRGPEKILDENLKTFWGSKWDQPKPFPYYIGIDMGKENQIFKLGLDMPEEGWRGNVKSGYFEVSSDNQNWIRVGDWSRSSNDERSVSVNISTQKARYIRLTITDAFDYADPTKGKEGGARCDIAEVNAWGL